MPDESNIRDLGDMVSTDEKRKAAADSLVGAGKPTGATTGGVKASGASATSSAKDGLSASVLKPGKATPTSTLPSGTFGHAVSDPSGITSVSAKTGGTQARSLLSASGITSVMAKGAANNLGNSDELSGMKNTAQSADDARRLSRTVQNIFGRSKSGTAPISPSSSVIMSSTSPEASAGAQAAQAAQQALRQGARHAAQQGAATAAGSGIGATGAAAGAESTAGTAVVGGTATAPVALIVAAVAVIIMVLVALVFMIVFTVQSSTTEATNLTGNEQIVASYLMAHGYDALHTAAIMGNWQQESSMNPTDVNPSSGAYGIVQWLYSRLNNLYAFASAEGKAYSDIAVQLDYFYGEATKGGPAASYASTPGNYSNAGFMATTDISDAVYYFGRNFEVCGESEANWENRLNAAAGYYAALSGNGSSAVAIAMQQIGKPYVWGASGPDSFDCSGLVYYCFSHAGLYSGSRTTADGFMRMCTIISASQAQAGDLVFYCSGGAAYHVGIYVGNGRMIDAPQTGENVSEQVVWAAPAGDTLVYGRMPTQKG